MIQTSQNFTPMDGLSLHLGRWEGRFIQIDPDQFIPHHQRQSLITFEATSTQGIRQTNAYFELDEPLDETRAGQKWIYHELSPGLFFFPDGSFSNGKLQLAPFSEFGAEQGFLWNDHKARVVTVFDQQGQLKTLTVILEVRGPWQDQQQAFATSILTPEQLNRPWRGQQICFLATDLIPQESSVEITSPDPDLRFLPGNLWLSGARQVPNPLKQRDRSFQVALGWLPEPQLYLQLIREYDEQGAWKKVTWIRTTPV